VAISVLLFSALKFFDMIRVLVSSLLFLIVLSQSSPSDEDKALDDLSILFSSSESEFIEQIPELPWTKESAKIYFENSIDKGWYEAAERVVEQAKENSIDLTHAVHAQSSLIHKKLEKLKEILGSGKDANGIPPAFEWAQSPTSILLNVKFSHKLDTPATLGCEATNVTFDTNSFRFVATCLEKRKVFDLKLALLHDIVPHTSSWAMAAVGRAQVTLSKAKPGSWSRLIQSKAKLAHSHVWWTMRERYEAENSRVDAELKAIAKELKKNSTSSEPSVVPEVKDESTSTVGSAQKEAEAAPSVASKGPLPDKFSSDELYAKLRKSLEEQQSEALMALDKELNELVKAVDKKAKEKRREAEKEYKAVRARIDDEAEKEKADLRTGEHLRKQNEVRETYLEKVKSLRENLGIKNDEVEKGSSVGTPADHPSASEL
jgi:hypothetical protein